MSAIDCALTKKPKRIDVKEYANQTKMQDLMQDRPGYWQQGTIVIYEIARESTEA